MYLQYVKFYRCKLENHSPGYKIFAMFVASFISVVLVPFVAVTASNPEQPQITFEDIPWEVQAMCKIPCPLNRSMVGLSSIEGCFANKRQFFKTLQANANCYHHFDVFFGGKNTNLSAEEVKLVHAAYDYMVEANFISKEHQKLLHIRKLLKNCSPSTFEKAAQEYSPNEKVFFIMLGLKFKVGSFIEFQDPMYAAVLKAFYPQVYKDVDMMASVHEKDPKRTLRNLFFYNFAYSKGALFYVNLKADMKRWCLELLANYNTNLKDRFSVMHLLLDESAVNIIKDCDRSMSKLVRICIQAIRENNELISQSSKDLNAVEKAQAANARLQISLKALLKTLDIQQNDVERVINKDYSVEAMKNADSNIF